jgi:hypothetical protein
MTRRRDREAQKVLALLIAGDPDREIRVDVVEPGLEEMRVRGVAVELRRDDRASRGVVTTVSAIGIGYAARGGAVPAEIGSILTK